MIAPPKWLVIDARAWFHQSECVIGRVDERGVVLEQRRRGLNPVRRLLSPEELSRALELNELRPHR